MATDRQLIKLPDSELDIMLVLWYYDSECKVVDIYNRLKESHPLSKTAIHTLLERLEKKGFIESKIVDAPVPYKTFVPVVTEKEYRTNESKNIVDKLFRGSWQNLIAALVDNGKITEKDIEEISRMIREKEIENSVKNGDKLE